MYTHRVYTSRGHRKYFLSSHRSVKAKELNKIGRIIVVMSGKGGVGKSLVSGMFAIALKRKGYDISILDADITGTSIPKMFGIKVPPSGFGKSLIKSLPYEVK